MLSVLDARRLNEPVSSKLKIVNVSLDAAHPENNRKIRGYSFETVIWNIRRLVEERRNRGNKYPLLYMNMTLMRSNIEELSEFIDLAVDLGNDTPRIQKIHIPIGRTLCQIIGTQYASDSFRIGV